MTKPVRVVISESPQRVYFIERSFVGMVKHFPVWHSILRVFLPPLCTVFLFIIAIFLVILPGIEQGYIERKKEMLTKLTDVQRDVLNRFYTREQSGELTREQAQQQAIDIIRHIRYGSEGRNYFWINNMQGRMVMHPYRPDLENDTSDPLANELLLRFVDIVQADCEGFIEYIWQRHDDISSREPKLSFVKGFAPWNWVIGTGVYIVDVEAEMRRFEYKIIAFSLIILAVVTMLSVIIIVQNTLSDRKRVEMAQNLQKSHAEYKSLVENVNIGIYRTLETGGGRFIKANTVMAQIFGYDSVDEILEVPPTDLYADPAERSLLIEEIKQHGTIKNKRLRIKKKNGQLFWGLVSINAVFDDKGELQFFDGVVEDITDQVRMAEEKEHLLKRLAEKNEELESILYVSSHDLRTPLITIQGFCNELGNCCNELFTGIDTIAIPEKSKKKLAPLVSDEIPRCLSKIESAVRKITSLVDGLLRLSLLSTMDVTHERIDMDHLMRSIVTAKRSLIHDETISILVDSLPPCMGCEAAVRHIFENLIDNACHYRHPTRPLTIRISAHSEDAHVEYCVEDNGIGIEPEYQYKIFDIFQQLNPRDSSAGDGLGLTIVKRLLDRLDGAIRVESHYEHYTRFYVSLPKAE